MITLPEIVDTIVRPSHNDTPVSIAMLFIALRMIYGGEYA